MKRSVLKRLFLSGLPLAFLLVSCDVHEFPDPTEPAKYPVVLDLTFDTELPVYQTVDVKTRVSDDPQAYNLRYTVCIYRADAEGAFGREEERRMVVTKSVTAQPDLRIETQLEEGAYRFIVWTDFVDAGTQEHKFFRTDDFRRSPSSPPNMRAAPSSAMPSAAGPTPPLRNRHRRAPSWCPSR